MPFIIDGHNLIGVLPDIHLSDPDDEEQLILRLQALSARTGKSITVYFDRGVPGGEKNIRRGKLTAHFVSQARTADDAIMAHVRRLAKRTPNWTVVSSDHAVLNFAARQGARVQTCSEFAASLYLSPAEAPDEEPRDVNLTPDELKSWENLFAQDGVNKK
ncbi:MAG: NYN domain-containing protein [Anaerolineales bacterium]|nr:NYN domain-containing protein [Anaerolineales bacterium]